MLLNSILLPKGYLNIFCFWLLKLMFVICKTEFYSFSFFLIISSQILKNKNVYFFFIYHHNHTFRTHKKGHWTFIQKKRICFFFYFYFIFIKSRNIHRRKDLHNQISHGSKFIILNSFDNDHFVGTFDFAIVSFKQFHKMFFKYLFPFSTYLHK